jgi:transglutaminase-like putative cysteine protease
MSFDQRKRILLGVLALLAPLPLPFNEIVGWPSILVFSLAVALFLRRSTLGLTRSLPSWAMNLLGLVYVPFLLLDFSLFWQGRVLRPLLHLALFALVVKLFGLKREKDKWHVYLLVFFVFLAAMGTSVHPTVAIYMVTFLVLSLLLLARFAAFHVLSNQGLTGEFQAPVPLRRFLTVGTLLTLVLAVPLFALLPRLGKPYLVGPGGGVGGAMQSARFLEQIGMDVIGRARTSRAVAMRLEYETPPPVGHEMRFRAAVYNEYHGDGWSRGKVRTQRLARQRDGFFHIAEGQSRSWLGVWLEPVASVGLVLPVEALTVDVATPTMHLDDGGLTHLQIRQPDTLRYRVGLSSSAELHLGSGLPPPLELDEATRLEGGERIAALAEEVAGTAEPAEQARRIQSYLTQEYTYSLDLLGIRTDRPVEDFLFEFRRGHCEYFASSMVLMLRSIGLPARLVTGYLGGEYNPFEDYYVVRQSNAHAWVEAYLPDRGWTTFDPTPPSGLPASSKLGWSLLASQAYDYLLFRWDRYVLTFGFYDQLGIARRLAVFWSQLWQGGDREEKQPRKAAPEEGVESPHHEPDSSWQPSAVQVIPLGLVLLLGAWWTWRHRPAFSGARAYRQLRARSEKEPELSITSSVPPLELAARIARQRPVAWASVDRVVELYLQESFGGRELSEEERRELKQVLRDALKNLSRRDPELRGEGGGEVAA